MKQPKRKPPRLVELERLWRVYHEAHIARQRKMGLSEWLIDLPYVWNFTSAFREGRLNE